MVLIEFSAFFSALVHCVMAYFQDQPVLYDAVSPIPDYGILRTPSYDKIPEDPTPDFIVKPSWQYKPEVSGLVGNDKVKDIQSKESKPKEPKHMTPLKGIGYTYPLRAPRVKLRFVGLNGMLPVKIIDERPVHKPEPTITTKPAPSHISAKDNVKDKLVGRVELHKDINKASLLGKLAKPELKQEALFKPDLNPVQPGLVQNPDILTFPLPEIDYGNNQDIQAFPFTSTNNPVLSGTDALKPTNFNYPTNPEYGKDLDKTNPYTYGTLAPETAVSNAHLHKVNNNPVHGTYQPTLSIQVLKPDSNHLSTQPDYKDDLKAVQLPPVPTTMSVLQRTQLALLNTVAGLPGGVPQALEALRPRQV